jgi:hypothetical protein
VDFSSTKNISKNKKVLLKIKNINRSFLLLTILLVPSLSRAVTYTPLENIPGYPATGDFYVYLSYIYKFGIGAVGVAAMLMIVIGAFMYVTSVGSPGGATTGKKFITDALLGLLLAMTSYLLLYTINPELVTFKKLQVVPGAPGGGVSGGGGAGGGFASSGACLNGNCTQIDLAIQNCSFGVDKVLLKSLAAGGEGCAAKSSPKGACGFFQTMPAIRKWCGITGTAEETCAKIQADRQLDANCAAKLIADNARQCGTSVRGVASCYNTGKPNNCANSERDYCGRVEKYYNSCLGK